MFKRPIPAFGLGILVALLALTLAHPDGRAALARIPGLLQIGEHTVIVTEKQFSDAQVDSILVSFDAAKDRGESVFHSTPYGGWGGAVPEGGDPFIKEASSIRVAAGLVDYPLLVPTYYNERIPPLLRFQKAVILPEGAAMLYFGIGPLETVIQLLPVSEGGTVSFSQTLTTTDEDGNEVRTVVQPDLEELEIGGRKVVWIKHDEATRNSFGSWAVRNPEVEIGRFHWEQDGLSCVLNGKYLTKDEGTRIIESLKRYGDN